MWPFRTRRRAIRRIRDELERLGFNVTDLSDEDIDRGAAHLFIAIGKAAVAEKDRMAALNAIAVARTKIQEFTDVTP